MPSLRLVRGKASPEELAALVAVLATIPDLATGGGGLDPTDQASLPRGRYPASQWSTHRRVFHTAYPHGAGGWRASALPG